VVGAPFAVGTVLGAWLARAGDDDRTLARQFVAAAVTTAAGIALIGLSPDVFWVALGGVVIGTGNRVLNVVAQHLFIRRTPPERLGRVMAALQGAVNAAMITSLVLGGVLAEGASPRSLFLVISATGWPPSR
jgi:MFS family permease